MRIFTVVSLIILSALSFQSRGQQKAILNESAAQLSLTDTGTMPPCFPLKRDNIYAIYNYIIDLHDNRVAEKYAALFDKYGFEFTAYSWQSILKQIVMQSNDEDLCANVFVKSDGDIVGFNITLAAAFPQFRAFICNILSNTQTFEKHLRKLDRARVSHY